MDSAHPFQIKCFPIITVNKVFPDFTNIINDFHGCGKIAGSAGAQFKYLLVFGNQFMMR